MSSDPTSFDHLHDIVEPPPVSWWPPAPGWYVVIAVAAVLLIWLAVHRWRQWRANAYRRAALRELANADSAAGISELLRRTALVVAPRTTIAALTGEKWAAWLADSTSAVMPPNVRTLLAGATYQPVVSDADVASLKDYARTWIESHPSQC